MAAESFGEPGISSTSKPKKPAVAGQGLFDLTFEKDSAGPVADRSVSDIWPVPARDDTKSLNMSALKKTPRSKWFPHLMAEPLSPAQARTRQGSHALRRRSNLTDQIKRQQETMNSLEEVMSGTSSIMHTPHEMKLSVGVSSYTPGSLLKSTRLESTKLQTPSRCGSNMEQTLTTPKMLSVLDETGAFQNLLVETPSMSQTTKFDTTFETEGDLTLFDTSLRPSSPENLLLQNPAEKTGSNLVHLFHDCFSSYSKPADVLEFIKGLQMACQNQMDELNKLMETTNDVTCAQLMRDLNLERSTWELIYVLYSDRVKVETMDDDWDMEPSIITHTAPVRSDRKLAEDLFAKDSSIRQAQLVVDWLETNAYSNLMHFPEKIRYFTDEVLWEATLSSLEDGSKEPNMVTELDPDASTRQDRKLADSDHQDEQTLMKHLFTCIRAGQVAEAQELCVNMGEPWRAASIEGWKLYHDPNAGKNLADDTIEHLEGNLTRDLWKLSCWEFSRAAGYSKYEKAIYATLAGDIKNILPVCANWNDYVWAYFRVMVDVLTEQNLRGCSPSTGQPVESLPNEYWNSLLLPELVFQEIEATPSVAEESHDSFHLIHKFVILGDLESLVNAIHGWLQDNPSIHHFRFWAHLVLFVKGLGAESQEEEKCDVIVESYVRELTSKRFTSLVAQYTAQLPPNLQVSCYAELLTGIQNPRDQRLCLDLGKKAGLDIAVITKSVVEQIRNTGLETSNLEGASLELGSTSEVEMTKVDLSKIEVIKWLVFEESQRAEAIIQGNALMRQFLASRKLAAARDVLIKLPSDSIQVIRSNWENEEGDVPLSIALVNAIKEYNCIKAYLNAIESFNTWLQLFHQNRPEPPQRTAHSDFRGNVEFEQKMKTYRSEEIVWQVKLCSLSEEVEFGMMDVLTFADGGWMVDVPGDLDSADENRARQMRLLRETCIPQIAFLLHNVLHSTDQYSKCLKIADVIASEQFKLYKLFRQHELEKLLSLFHKSGCAMVDDSKTYLGYPL